MNSICGAQCKSTGKPCQNIAGKGTDHVGEGRCRHHGGATPIQHGLYSKIHRARLGKRMADIAGRNDLLRLDQEVAMMKVLLEQLLERDQSRVAALHAWHLTTSGAFKTLVETNDASQIRDALLALRAAEPLRPAELPDLVIVATLVEKIGRTVERIHKTTNVCTRDQLQRILDQMGAVVAKHVIDEETNQKIRDGWLDIVLEGR